MMSPESHIPLTSQLHPLKKGNLCSLPLKLAGLLWYLNEYSAVEAFLHDFRGSRIKDYLVSPLLLSPEPLWMQDNCCEATMWWEDPNRPHVRTDRKCRDLLKRNVQSALSYYRPPCSQLQPLRPEPIIQSFPDSWPTDYEREEDGSSDHGEH